MCRVNPLKPGNRHVTLHVPHVQFAGCTTENPVRTEIHMVRFGSRAGAGLEQHMFTVERDSAPDSPHSFNIVPEEPFLELIREIALSAQSNG